MFHLPTIARSELHAQDPKAFNSDMPLNTMVRMYPLVHVPDYSEACNRKICNPLVKEKIIHP